MSIEGPLDALRRRRLTLLRNVLILFASAAVMAVAYGVPALRVTYQYSPSPGERYITSARYWTLTGWRESEIGEDCPIVRFYPLSECLREAFVPASEAIRTVDP